MSNRLVGSATFIVSLSAMFFFVGFSFPSLWKTLRKRKLTVRELLVYVAGAGVAMALPNCFYIESERYVHVVVMWWKVRWFSFLMTLLSLALVVFLIHSSSKT
jgi:hypothetical protein